MIRVLNLFTTLDNGGVESFLLNYYTHMNRNLIQYDFVVPGEKIGFLEERFIKMGCNVFHVPTFHQNPITQIYKIAHIRISSICINSLYYFLRAHLLL